MEWQVPKPQGSEQSSPPSLPRPALFTVSHFPKHFCGTIGFDHPWEDCQKPFLLIWPIRTLKHRELKRPVGGHAAGQRQSWAQTLGNLCKSPAPASPPHSPARLCGGIRRHHLFPLLFMHSTTGTGPLMIKAPRDRKAQLKHSWKNKTTPSTGTSPGGNTGVPLRT